MAGVCLSSLHPDPGQHTVEAWVFIKPVAGSAVCAAKVTDDMVVRYTIKLLH